MGKAQDLIQKKKDAEEILNDVELPKEFEKEAEEKGWDIEFSGSFVDEERVKPKIRLTRKAVIGDTIRAEELARKAYDLPTNREPSVWMSNVCKLAILCTFNGETWGPDKIGELDTDFLVHIWSRWARYLL